MVPTSADPMAATGLEDLREHDREVLEFLSQDPAGQIAFQGIRRRLGIHPEQLSRALHRLAEDDLVQKTEIGYRVTSKALAFLSPKEWVAEAPGTTILRTYLPANVDLRSLVAALRGSWIGPLRWYGLSESNEELRLAWALEDETLRLDIQIRAGQLTVMAHGASPDRLDEATRLGYLVFRQIAGEVGRDPMNALVS